MDRSVLLFLILVSGLLGTALAAPGLASDEINLEAAEDDSGTVSFIFETGDNVDKVTIEPAEDTDFGSDITFAFDHIEAVNGGFDRYDNEEISVENNTQYRVVYTADTDAPVQEDGRSADIDVYEDGSLAHEETLTVNLLKPEFGEPDDDILGVVFKPANETVSETGITRFNNIGDGTMIIEDIEVTTSNSKIDTNIRTEIDDIESGPENNKETLPITATFPESIEETEQEITVELTDNLGNSAQAKITADIVKPPAAGVPEEEVEVGELFPGKSVTNTFTIEERGGYKPIDSIESDLRDSPTDGSISFPELDEQSLTQDGSGTQEVEITVDEDADRGELSWSVDFSPSDSNGVKTATPVDFVAEVIYPPYYESLQLPNSTFVFDEPKDSRSSFSIIRELTIENGGDRPMELDSATADIVSPQQPINASVENPPSSIPAGGDADVTVDITAENNTREGTWTLEVETNAEEPATLPDEETGTATVEASVAVEHETEIELTTNEIEIGNVTITDSERASTDITERLGYQAVRNFSLKQTSGPNNDWLEVTQPEELPAGETEQFAVAVRFPPSTDTFSTYEWEFVVDGDNVERQQIVVTATPEPVDFDDTIAELDATESSTEASTAVLTNVSDALEILESRLRSNEKRADPKNTPRLVTGASSSIILVEAAEQARTLIDEGNRTEAQAELVRAAAAFNTFTIATADISGDKLQERVDSSRNSADRLLAQLIREQREYFQQRLARENATILQRAQVNRELAQLAELSGNQENASRLRRISNTAFSRYNQTVSAATEDLISARETDEDLNLGIVLPWQRSGFAAKTDEALALYESAVEQFEEAGATGQAEAALAERRERANTYSDVSSRSLILWVGSGVLLLIILGAEGWFLINYRAHKKRAVSGDFLFPWNEIE